MVHFSKKTRRLLALSILACVCLTAYFLILSPLITIYRENKSSIERSKYTYSRFIKFAKNVDVQKQGVNTHTYKEYFFYGSGNDIILAEIQKQVKKISIKNQTQFLSARILPRHIEKGTTLLGVQVELVGRLEAIKKTIYHLEVSIPFLLVKQALLKPTRNNFRGLNGSQIFVSARLDVYGIVRSE